MEIEHPPVLPDTSQVSQVREKSSHNHFGRKRKARHQKQTHDRINYSCTPITQENALFEEYYKGFGWMSDDEFRNEFMPSLRRPLPTTFRITGSRSHAEEVRNYLLSHFVEPLKKLCTSAPLSNVTPTADTMIYTSVQPLSMDVPPPTPLPWYENNLAWQWNFSRNSLKKARQLRKQGSSSDAHASKQINSTDPAITNENPIVDNEEKEEEEEEEDDEVEEKEDEKEEDEEIEKEQQQQQQQEQQLLDTTTSNSLPVTDPTNTSSPQQQQLADLVHQFHEWLVAETQLGNVSRQEAVSMLPPLLLQVTPNEKVLDMCAAPGSKTAQLIEALHTQTGPRMTSSTESVDDVIQSVTGGDGLVMANDADAKRCYTLVHQVKRLSSPCTVVTNYDAMNFPNMYLREENSNSDNTMTLLQFDKVLCDVPCSGDGTLRKNPQIWRTWTPQHAHGLHRMQYRILERGAQLAKIGAKIVYSTCSLNPIENEAVVATLLLNHPGCYRLCRMDQHASLWSTLKKRPGVSDWSVMMKQQNGYVRVARHEAVPEELREKYPSTLFSSEQHLGLDLQACWRILPHDQDTGGFFIAVLEKLQESTKKELVRRMPVKEGEAGIESEGLVQQQQQKQHHLYPKRGSFSVKEEPFLPVSSTDTDIDRVLSFYGLSCDFPVHHLMVRSDIERKQSYYFVGRTVHRLLSTPLAAQVRFVNTGVKVFARNEAKGDAMCPYRVCQEGLRVVLPFMTGRSLLTEGQSQDRCRVIGFSRSVLSVFQHVDMREDVSVYEKACGDVRRLLAEGNVLFHELACGQFRQHLMAWSVGCGILLLDFHAPPMSDEGKVGSSQRLVDVLERAMPLACWRGRSSISILAIKEERQSLLSRFNDLVTSQCEI